MLLHDSCLAQIQKQYTVFFLKLAFLLQLLLPLLSAKANCRRYEPTDLPRGGGRRRGSQSSSRRDYRRVGHSPPRD